MRRLAWAALLWAAGCGGSNGTSATTSTPGASVDLAPHAADAGDAGRDGGVSSATDAGAPFDAAPPSDAALPPADLALPPSDAALPPSDAALPGDGGASDGGGSPACTTTTPVTLVSGLHSAGSLQVDDENIYYLDVGPFALSRAPKTGGTPTLIFNYGGINDDVWSDEYAIDANLIYVMRYGHAGMNVAPGSIQYYDKASATLLRDVPPSEPNDPTCYTPILIHMAVVDGIVFYDQAEGYRNQGCVTLPDEIGRLAPGDSMGTVIAAVSGSDGVKALAATHDAVWWSDDSGVERLPNGSTTTQLVAPVAPPTILVSDGSAIYWTDGTTLRRSTAAGTRALTTQPFYPQADDGHTLFGLTTHGDVSEPIVDIGNDGSGYTTTSVTAGAVAIDAQYIYFSTGTTIQRVCR